MFKKNFKTTIRNLWKAKAHQLLYIFGANIGTNGDNAYKIKDLQKYHGLTYTCDATPRLLASPMKNDLPGYWRTK